MISIVTGLAKRMSHMREASVQTPGLFSIRSGPNHRTRFQFDRAQITGLARNSTGYKSPDLLAIRLAATPAKPAPSPPRSSGQPVQTAKPTTPLVTHTTTKFRCTGQWHHGITKQIHTALERHPLLKGVYKYRDDRFVTQAIDKAAHNGWEKWHRAMEKKVVDWIYEKDTATPAQFEAWLRNLYKTDKDLDWRFPNGF